MTTEQHIKTITDDELAARISKFERKLNSIGHLTRLQHQSLTLARREQTRRSN